MALPFSRDKTFLAGDAISASFLNAIQDTAIDGYESRRVLNPGPIVDDPAALANWALSYDGVLSASNDGEAARRELGALPVGRTLTQIEVQADIPAAGTSELTVSLRVADDNGAISSASTQSTLVAGLQIFTVTPTAGNEVIRDNRRYFLQYETADSAVALGSNFEIYNITLVFA